MKEIEKDRPERDIPPRNLKGKTTAKMDEQSAHAERDRMRAQRSRLQILQSIKRKGYWWPGER